TAEKSVALAAALLDAPDKGLAIVAYAMALSVFRFHGEAVVKMSAASQSLHRVAGAKAFEHMEAARAAWGQRLPHTADSLWNWCLEQDGTVLLDLLTFCAAATVNAIRLKSDRADAERLLHAEQLATALGLDMSAWFTPTAANYFGRVSKAQVL